MSPFGDGLPFAEKTNCKAINPSLKLQTLCVNIVTLNINCVMVSASNRTTFVVKKQIYPSPSITGNKTLKNGQPGNKTNLE